jgi:protein TonB
MNARHAPHFLVELGLEDIEDVSGLDERALRRAYAKRLKQIDIEADPAAFQTLREALDCGIAWATLQKRRAAAEAAEAEAEATATRAGAGPADVAAPAPRGEPDAARGEPEPPPAEPAPPREAGAGHELDIPRDPAAPRSPAPMRDPARPSAAAPDPVAPRDPPPVRVPPPSEVADAVFDDCMPAALAAATDAAAARRALVDALADDRLQNVDARAAFEQVVAHRLCVAWRPGHEHLFDAAFDYYEWQADHARLQRLRQAGDRLAGVLHERLQWERLPSGQRTATQQLLERLRKCPPVDNATLAAEVALLNPLVQRMPHWLAMVVPVDAVNERLNAWRAFPPDVQTQLARRRGAVPPSVAAREKQGGGFASYAYGLALLVVLVIGVSMFGGRKTGMEGAGRSALDRGFWQTTSSSAMAARQAEAEALLGRVQAASAPANQSGKSDR